MAGPKTVEEYLAALPEERRLALQAVREVFQRNLSGGFEEGIQYGMVGYYVPLSVYPPGYHCTPDTPLPFAGMASQKNHMSIYLMGLYSNPDELAKFEAAWKATGLRLDMGKSCIRFRKLEQVPLKVLAATLKRLTLKKFLRHYEAEIENTSSRRKATGSKKSASKKSASKKSASKKSASKKSASRKSASKKSASKKSASRKSASRKSASRKSASKKSASKKSASK
ncbi:MAG: DUF1801 domain-containing protein, partial [Planctomycetaceae bacterium]|nr:DUF1801 domain-containing protein [Planctomycetaceae bacterium]